MPLIQLERVPVREIFPGLRARLVHSDRVSHSWVEVDAGATFPEHQHPHEQIVNVLAGELELVVEGETHRLKPGMVFVIPPNAQHSGRGHHGLRVLRCVCARQGRLQVNGSKVARFRRSNATRNSVTLQLLEPCIYHCRPIVILHHVGLAVLHQRNRAVIDLLAVELGAQHAGPDADRDSSTPIS